MPLTLAPIPLLRAAASTPLCPRLSSLPPSSVAPWKRAVSSACKQTPAFARRTTMLLSCLPPFLGLNGVRTPLSPCCTQVTNAMHVTMRDRSKNRKPLQKGRNLSIEAIQAVQALKRAKATEDGDAVEQVMQMKVRRLIKFDLMAVLGELQSQNEGSLALQVFEEVRREHWYKPQLSVYADMVRVLTNSNLLQKMEILSSYMKLERFKDDTLGLNALLENLLAFGFSHIAMDCYAMMKLCETEPDESTFRILINGLESNGECALSVAIREEAKYCFGGYVDFSEKTEHTDCTKESF